MKLKVSELTLNSNLILLIQAFVKYCINGFMGFKFQSDSINTLAFHKEHKDDKTTLNSNLILLIPVFKDTFKTTGYNTYFCRPQK